LLHEKHDTHRVTLLCVCTRVLHRAPALALALRAAAKRKAATAKKTVAGAKKLVQKLLLVQE
jgi:hypothetical protein